MNNNDMLPSPDRGRKQGQFSPWRGGGNWRGRNSFGSNEQQFVSPYQDVRSNPHAWTDPRPVRGAQQQRWQNRRSFGTPRGQQGFSYNRTPQNKHQVTDIRAYVIPAMTDNPWKHLEERFNTESTSAVEKSTN